MNRRGFLGVIAGLVAGPELDPERLLWRPGKLISIPKPTAFQYTSKQILLSPELLAEMTLEQLKHNIAIGRYLSAQTSREFDAAFRRFERRQRRYAAVIGKTLEVPKPHRFVG